MYVIKRFATLTLTLTLLVSAGYAEQLIGFIDLQKVFDEYWETKIADKELKGQAELFNTERKGLLEKFEKQELEFEALRKDALDEALSEVARKKKRAEAEELRLMMREDEIRVRKFDKERKGQLEAQGKRMRKRIVGKIETVIEGYAQKQGYSVVMDQSGQSFNGVSFVIYENGRNDITDDILELLNKGKP